MCPRCSAVPQESLLALPLGTLLNGQYRVGLVLGSGGFGITYLAFDERLDRPVAVKEFFPRDLVGRSRDSATVVPHTRGDGETFALGRERFLAEARVLARFDHPNIVRVRTFFEANETGYLVMDYYEGRSLEIYLGEQPGSRIPERVAVQILMHVLDALRAVHGAGLLHRDIKPQNIYVTEERRILLLDFGAARQATGEHSRSEIVTGGYAPWEQYSRRGNQGPWTDVYASAASLYRMVTGERPLDAPDRVHDDTMASARELEPSVSGELSEVVQRGLAVRPENRPQSAEEFQSLLTAAMSPVVSPSPPVQASPIAMDRKVGPPELLESGEGKVKAAGAGEMSTFWDHKWLPWAAGGGLVVLLLIWVVASGKTEKPISAGTSPLSGLKLDSMTDDLRNPVPQPPAATPQAPRRILGAIGEMRFFESAGTPLPLDQRRYTDVFHTATTRFIHVELFLSHHTPQRLISVPVKCTYSQLSDNSSVGVAYGEISVEPGDPNLSHTGWHEPTINLGWHDPGNWRLGTYRVECFAQGNRIARETFSIYAGE